jgi:uncharacterized protein YutE (UPF0331/DUF86 family)
VIHQHGADKSPIYHLYLLLLQALLDMLNHTAKVVSSLNRILDLMHSLILL